MPTFELIDCCPVPAVVAPAVREVKRRSGQALTSCDRSREAEPYLARCGKKSQYQLWLGYIHGLPGYNPANRPGTSTHERRNDGVAFRLPVGARIPDEEVGQDWTSGAAVAQAYRNMGILAALTYPTSVRERQHVNIRVTRSHWKWATPDKPLSIGSRGPRVVVVIRRLQFCVSPSTHKRYLPAKVNRWAYTAQVARAVGQFQRDHGLRADGVAGPHTLHQLAVSTRWWKQHRRKR